MPRTYGKYKFVSENIVFIQNYKKQAGKYNEHLLEHLITKNILLELYDNPLSIKDLSFALNCDPVYLEDIVNSLVDYGIVHKVEDCYRTGIVILSKKNQNELENVKEETAHQLFTMIQPIITELDEKDALPLLPFAESKNDLLSSFIPSFTETLCRKISYIKHCRNEEWVICGVEVNTEDGAILDKCFCERHGMIYTIKNYPDMILSERKYGLQSFFGAMERLDGAIPLSLSRNLECLKSEFALKRKMILEREIPEYLQKTAFTITNDIF